MESCPAGVVLSVWCLRRTLSLQQFYTQVYVISLLYVNEYIREIIRILRFSMRGNLF